MSRRVLIAVSAVLIVLVAAVVVGVAAGAGPNDRDRLVSCLERHGARPTGSSSPPAGAKLTFTARIRADGSPVRLLDLGRDRRPVLIGSPDHRLLRWRAGSDRARRAFWACVALVSPRPLP